LAEHYAGKGFQTIGCSRELSDFSSSFYEHFCLDVADEPNVKAMFSAIRKKYGCLDILINNAGIASMNHTLLTPLATVRKILETNVLGIFLCCREAAKLMLAARSGGVHSAGERAEENRIYLCAADAEAAALHQEPGIPGTGELETDGLAV